MSYSNRNTVRGLSLVMALAMAGVGTFFLQDWARGEEAEHDAEAQKVLRQMSEYYKKMDTFSVDATLTRKAEIQGRSMDSSVNYRLAMERPNKFIMEPGEGNSEGGGVVASDGEKLLMYVPQVDKYTKEQSPESLDAVLEKRVVAMLSGGIGGFVGTLMTEDPYASLTEGASGSSYVGEEEIDGQGYHRIRLDRQGGAYDLWIAQGEKPTLVKMVPDLTQQLERARQAGQNVEMEVELRMDQWEPNAELAEDRFAFSPPENAQEVDSFFDEQQGSRSGGNEHALVGKQAPGFKLSQLGGGEVDLASHQGENIVILDFWATWCGPCVKAMPIIEKVASEYRDQGVVLYAVNLKEGEGKINNFLDEHELDVNVLLDKQGQVAQKYQASSIPQTVIIDTDGSVQAVHVGLLPDLESKLSDELEQLLAGNKLVD